MQTCMDKWYGSGWLMLAGFATVASCGGGQLDGPGTPATGGQDAGGGAGVSRPGGDGGAAGGNIGWQGAPHEAPAYPNSGPFPRAAEGFDPLCANAPVEADTGWRLLSRPQYLETLRGLFGAELDGEHAQRLLDRLRPALERLPIEPPALTDAQAGLRRESQLVTATRIEGYAELAFTAGEAIAASEPLAFALTRCPEDARGTRLASCVQSFVARFGERAFRHPPRPAVVTALVALHPDGERLDPRRIGRIVATILQSPEFLYRVEHGQTAVVGAPGVYQLSPFELAARLSYHFWNAPPDEELLRLARDGSLARHEVLVAQARRLVSDPRAGAVLQEFFFDYLGLDGVPQLDANQGDPAFRTFAGRDLPGPALRGQVQREALDMALYSVEHDERLVDLVTARRSFARSPELARILGASVWDGVGAPPTLTNHPGLFTHPWLQASGTVRSRPIDKGTILRTRFLCEALPRHPSDVFAEPPVETAGLSTRAAVVRVTEREGTSCRGCHAAYINPLGFALEGYDGLGRYRTEELLIDPHSVGEAIARVPVDTRVAPRVVLDDPRVVEGAEGLARHLVESGKLERCLARWLDRFTFQWQRSAAPAPSTVMPWDPLRPAGVCATDALADVLRSNSLRHALASVARLHEFRVRRFAGDDGVPAAVPAWPPTSGEPRAPELAERLATVRAVGEHYRALLTSGARMADADRTRLLRHLELLGELHARLAN